MENKSNPSYSPERKTDFAIFSAAHIATLMSNPRYRAIARSAKNNCPKKIILSPAFLIEPTESTMSISSAARNAVLPPNPGNNTGTQR